MRVVFTFDLSETHGDARDSSQAPLHWDGRQVVLPTSRFLHAREARGVDPTKRGVEMAVHFVSPSGQGTVTRFPIEKTLVAQSWSFLELGGELVLHTGSFHTLPDCKEVSSMPFVDASDGSGRGIFLERDGRLFFADAKTPIVHCHDVASKGLLWNASLPSKHPYRVGPIDFHDGLLVCHGHDSLCALEPSTGKVLHQRRFPRVDKLYAPVRHGDDLLFPFTNWTSGGLLRFDPARKEVVWKFTKKGPITPPRGGPLPVVDGTAIVSVNGGSSLAGVDVESGKERWRFHAQWLYTGVVVAGRSLVFGTSGGRGGLRCIDAGTGETTWDVPMSSGCTHMSHHGDDVVVGDWGGVLRRVRASDGAITDELELGAPLAGPPLCVGARVYVVRWPTDGSNSTLVAVEM